MLPVAPAGGFQTSDSFQYTCHRCLRCCAHKRIRVNPYEVYRLARNRGLSTTAFIAEHTIEGGTELARREDGTCVFLSGEGCAVHADRPLVCRLYPLGRHVVPGKRDRYFMVETHPESEGVFGGEGTVESFLTAQGVGPFAAAADRYHELVLRLGQALSMRAAVDSHERVVAEEVLAAAPVQQEWLDIDAVIGEGPGHVPENDPDAALTRHIAILERQLLSSEK
jgi:Fe-S-cluster containining protein